MSRLGSSSPHIALCQEPFWQPIGKFVFAFGQLEKQIDWCISSLLHAETASQHSSVASQIRNLCSRIAIVEALKAKDDRAVGVEIVKRALEEPVRQIVNNTGMEGSVVVQELKGKEGANGFNAQTEKYEDLMAAGVIDPTKVVRIALENAASVSALLLTTEAVVAEKPKEEKMPPMPPGAGGGYGDMY